MEGSPQTINSQVISGDSLGIAASSKSGSRDQRQRQETKQLFDPMDPTSGASAPAYRARPYNLNRNQSSETGP